MYLHFKKFYCKRILHRIRLSMSKKCWIWCFWCKACHISIFCVWYCILWIFFDNTSSVILYVGQIYHFLKVQCDKTFNLYKICPFSNATYWAEISFYQARIKRDVFYKHENMPLILGQKMILKNTKGGDFSMWQYDHPL